MAYVRRRIIPLLALVCAVAATGCDDDDPRPDGGDGDGGDGDGGEACPLPSGGVYATFLVTDDVFRAHITDADAIQQAIDLWQGNSNASIPNGDLICEPADFNCGYSWHLDPANIEFAELTVEVCDGSPSYIEDNCEDFSVDYYCPWNAELIDLRDCSEPDCPQVPRDPA